MIWHVLWIYVSNRTLTIEGADYSVFAAPEGGRFRTFWFCPFLECYGSYRSDELVETREAAYEQAAEAARQHHFKKHCDCSATPPAN